MPYRSLSVFVVRIIDEPTADQDNLSKPRASQQLFDERFATFAGVSSDERNQLSGHLDEYQAKREYDARAECILEKETIAHR